MFTLTITLKNTHHQIVLVFDKYDAAGAAEGLLREHGDAVDNYGQSATVLPVDILTIVLTDLQAYWKYQTKLQIIKLRAEAEFKAAATSDPTLQFLSGGNDLPFRAR